MDGRKITLTDDQSDFIVYHPLGQVQLPAIPNSGLQIVSIDPAIKNFAIRVEKRYQTGVIETVYMEKFNFKEYGDVAETKGTTKVDPAILNVVLQILGHLFPIVKESHIIMIERQMAKNYKSTRIYQHLMTYFLMIISQFSFPCILLDISPKLKGKMLQAPKGLNYNGLKAWSITKATELLQIRGDQLGLSLIQKPRGKGKTDDLADTVVQIEAWFILVGGVVTQKPIVMEIQTSLTLDQYLGK